MHFWRGLGEWTLTLRKILQSRGEEILVFVLTDVACNLAGEDTVNSQAS